MYTHVIMNQSGFFEKSDPRKFDIYVLHMQLKD